MVSRILKFTVHMALVVFEVGSLSKVMTNINMSLTVFEVDVGETHFLAYTRSRTENKQSLELT